jgi:hypothetical protein
VKPFPFEGSVERSMVKHFTRSGGFDAECFGRTTVDTVYGSMDGQEWEMTRKWWCSVVVVALLLHVVVVGKRYHEPATIEADIIRDVNWHGWGVSVGPAVVSGYKGHPPWKLWYWHTDTKIWKSWFRMLPNCRTDALSIGFSSEFNYSKEDSNCKYQYQI